MITTSIPPGTLTLERKHRALVRIVDDDPSVRRALSIFLTMDDWPIATYESATDFLERDDPTLPGCIVLDIRMPDMSGIELHQELIRRSNDLPVIFLSAHGDIEMAVAAIERGAQTFLVKPPQPEKLLAQVEKAVIGHFALRRETAYEQMLSGAWETLTAAEHRVALLIGKGFTNALAAKTLGVSERTIRSQRAAIYEKLDIENAVELADFLRDLPPDVLKE